MSKNTEQLRQFLVNLEGAMQACASGAENDKLDEGLTLLLRNYTNQLTNILNVWFPVEIGHRNCDHFNSGTDALEFFKQNVLPGPSPGLSPLQWFAKWAFDTYPEEDEEEPCKEDSRTKEDS